MPGGAGLLLAALVVGARGEVVKVVQRSNASTTLSCPLPPSWTSCTFVKDASGSEPEASCSVTNSLESNPMETCSQLNFGESKTWLYAERARSLCFLEVANLNERHNGTYSCTFAGLAGQEEGREEGSSAALEKGLPLVPWDRLFSLTILTIPSSVQVSRAKEPRKLWESLTCPPGGLRA